MNLSGFFETVAEKAPLGFARHFAFCELVQERSFSIDEAQSQLLFDGLAPIGMQLLGAFSSADQVYSWVWSQPQFGGSACDLAEHLRGQASVEGYELFGVAQLPVSVVHPFAIGLACAGVAGEACFWCAPIESGYLLVVVLNPPLDLTRLSFNAFSSAFAAAAEYYPDRRELVETMAKQLGLPLERGESSLVCHCGGEKFSFQYVPPTPTPGLLSLEEIESVERLLVQAGECEHNRDLTSLRVCLERALALHPESYDAHRMLAGLEMAEGNQEDAEMRYLICDQMLPKNSPPLVALAKIYAATGRPSLARAARRRVLELDPDRFSYYFYGEELARAGMFLEAQQMMEEATSLAEKPGPPLEYLGRLAVILGRRELAVAAYGRLIAEDGGDENAQAELERLRALI